MEKKNYDLIVIGAGSGGLGISLTLLELGLKVLLIDKEAENIGGECLNTGCVPSKALIHASKIIHQAKKAEAFGVNANGKVSLKKVLEYVNSKQNAIREHENIDFLRDKGLDVVVGWAKFYDRNSIEVEGQHFAAKRIVIATGSSPRTLDLKGMEFIKTYTNESVFQIEEIPKNFLFIGGGPISMELGQSFSRLGSKVTIVDRGASILGNEDQVISEVLFKKLQEENIDFLMNSEVEEINGDKEAIVKDKKGNKIKIKVDALFMGVGRVVGFEGMALEKAGIVIDEKGKIKLDEKLQTSNKNVFVSGDAADNLKFSHAAELHTGLLLNNLISPFKKKLDFDHFAWVTFTDPEVATFGFSEKQLKENGKDYERLVTDFSEHDRAITDDYEYGKLLLFIEKKKNIFTSVKILGGSMVAPNAGEIVQELILANSTGMSAGKLMNKIYPYPTAGNINKITIRKRSVKEVKPWMKKAARWLYRI